MSTYYKLSHQSNDTLRHCESMRVFLSHAALATVYSNNYGTAPLHHVIMDHHVHAELYLHYFINRKQAFCKNARKNHVCWPISANFFLLCPNFHAYQHSGGEARRQSLV